MKTKFSLLLLTLSLLSWTSLQTRADTIALSFSNNLGEGIAKDATLGWSFSLSTSVSVTQLGVWDGPNQPIDAAPSIEPVGVSGGPVTVGDGLLSGELITIWTSTGTFITSATVPAAGGTLDSGFRYVSIAPTLLGAGNYVIGAYYGANNQDRNAAITNNITTAPQVTYGQGMAGAGNAFPVGPFAGGGIWGPNFQFVAPTNGVPETGASWALLAISLGGILGLRSITKRRAV